MASDQPSRKQNIIIGIMAAAALGSLVLEWALVSYNQVDTIPFSQFERLVGEGSVTEVTVGQDIIQGRVKDKLPSGKSAFVTARVDAALADKLAAKGVVVTGAPSGASNHSVVGHSHRAVLCGLDIHQSSSGSTGRPRRVHVDRQIASQGLCRKGH